MLAQSAISETRESSLKLEVDRYVLPNGLKVLLHRDSTIPLISHHIWYGVGSRNEGDGLTGATHMLEHMMFKGAEKYSGKEFDRLLHANGIVNNAFTSWEYTGYHMTLPSHSLSLVVDLEVDRMQSLKIDPSDLASELQVVAEERRLRVDNNPRGFLFEKLLSRLFRNTSYEWPVIGYMKDIQAYTSEKLRIFYKQFYQPGNAVLVLVGDFDVGNIKKLIQETYGKLPKKELPKVNFSSPQPLTEPERMDLVRKDVNTQSLLLGYVVPDTHHPDSFAIEIAAMILGQGQSSRLYRRLVIKEQWVSSISSFEITLDRAGAFLIRADLLKSATLEGVQKVIHEELKRLADSGPDEKEMRKAINSVRKTAVDQLLTYDGRAYLLAYYEMIFGNYETLYTRLEQLKRVTAQDVKRVVSEYLQPSRELMVTLSPGKD